MMKLQRLRVVIAPWHGRLVHASQGHLAPVENQKLHENHGRDGRATQGLVHATIHAIVLTLAMLALPAGEVSAQATQASARTNANVKGLLESVRKNSLDLRLASFAPPIGAEGSGDLRNAVEQVRAMDVSAAARERAADASGHKTTAQIAPALSGTPAQSQPSVPARKQITPATLELLRKNPPGDVKGLLAIADALFGSDEIDDAAVFYDLALQQSPAGDAKGWTLFQLANCRRTSDPAGARALFKRLADEAPNCPWANLAGAIDRVVEWEMAEKPQALLNRPTSEPTTSAPAMATTAPATMREVNKAE